MNLYMVSIVLPSYLTEEFVSLIPRQRAYVNTKMEEGVITGYSIAKDNTRLWVTFTAESKDAVMEVVEGFPLRKFIKPEVIELMFHDHVGIILPQLSLN